MRRVLGVALGTATLISLCTSGFSLELSGLPQKLYQDYVWLRDMLYEPIVMVARYFGLSVPQWLKDATIAYGLVAAAHWWAFRADHMYRALLLHTTPRAVAEMAEPQFNQPINAGSRPTRRKLKLIIALTSILGTIFWPLFHLMLWLRTNNLDAKTMLQVPRPQLKDACLDLTGYYEAWRKQVEAASSGLRQSVMLNLFVIVVLTGCFFFWNHVQNAFGPAG